MSGSPTERGVREWLSELSNVYYFSGKSALISRLQKDDEYSQYRANEDNVYHLLYESGDDFTMFKLLYEHSRFAAGVNFKALIDMKKYPQKSLQMIKYLENKGEFKLSSAEFQEVFLRRLSLKPILSDLDWFLDDARITDYNMADDALLKKVLEDGVRNREYYNLLRIIYSNKFELTLSNLSMILEKQLPLAASVIEAIRERPEFDSFIDEKGVEFLVAAIDADAASVYEQLLNDARIDPSKNENILIRKVAKWGKTKLLQKLLRDERVDPADANSDAFKQAVNSGSWRAAKILLQDGRIDPSIDNSFALVESIEASSWEVANLLLDDARIDPSANESEALARLSKSVLHLSVDRQNMLRRLLTYPRVDPSIKDNVLLRDVVIWGDAGILAKLLSDRRVDPNAKKNGVLVKATEYAKDERRAHIVSMLLSHPEIVPKPHFDWLQSDNNFERYDIKENLFNNLEYVELVVRKDLYPEGIDAFVEMITRGPPFITNLDVWRFLLGEKLFIVDAWNKIHPDLPQNVKYYLRSMDASLLEAQAELATRRAHDVVTTCRALGRMPYKRAIALARRAGIPVEEQDDGANQSSVCRELAIKYALDRQIVAPDRTLSSLLRKNRLKHALSIEEAVFVLRQNYESLPILQVNEGTLLFHGSKQPWKSIRSDSFFADTVSLSCQFVDDYDYLAVAITRRPLRVLDASAIFRTSLFGKLTLRAGMPGIKRMPETGLGKTERVTAISQSVTEGAYSLSDLAEALSLDGWAGIAMPDAMGADELKVEKYGYEPKLIPRDQKYYGKEFVLRHRQRQADDIDAMRTNEKSETESETEPKRRNLDELIQVGAWVQLEDEKACNWWTIASVFVERNFRYVPRRLVDSFQRAFDRTFSVQYWPIADQGSMDLVKLVPISQWQ